MKKDARLFLLRRESLLLGGILLLGICLRLPNLTESLWYDELWSTHVQLGSFRSLARTALQDLHPPFYSILMFVWIRIFGDSELSVRLLPLLFGLASICLTYAIARELISLNVALLAACLLCLSPVHIWYSQEARPYSALMFFLLLSVFAFLKLDKDDSQPIWSGVYFLSLFACALTHYYLASYLVVFSGLAVFRRHKHRTRLLWMNAVVFFCLVGWVLLRLSFAKLLTSQWYLRTFTPKEFWQLFFNWFSLGNVWPVDRNSTSLIVVQILLATLLVCGLVSLFRQPDGGKAPWQLSIYLFVIPCLLSAFSVIGLSNYIERSAYVALPFFLIILANGAIRWTARLTRYACASALLILSAAILATYFSKLDEWTVYKPNPDWRSAARFFEKEMAQVTGKTAVIAVTPADELAYYQPRFEIIEEFDSDLSRDADAGKKQRGQSPKDSPTTVYLTMTTEQTVRRADKLAESGSLIFFLVHNRYFSGRFKDAFNSLAKRNEYKPEMAGRFKGLEIYRFTINKQVDGTGEAQK